ncbi:MAG: FG-GAP-like repeat-containing protein [Planctomycetota bacterium]|nr:FG-GAP-like repeat-containing protein [Planctomycetota bacterium]
MRRTLISLAAAAGLATQASATWSIILINTRTGEIAVGSATCLTSFDLQAGTPVLIPGFGAATAQSSVDQGGFNRVFIRDRLLEGVDPSEIITQLEGFDNGHQTRQYGIASTPGGTATFTGDRAGSWAGGVTGRVGDVVYAVQGNVLTGAPVVLETEQTIVSSIDSGLDLAGTLMLAMEEARTFGGDGRCSCDGRPDDCGSPPDGYDTETDKSAHIAYMLIARTGDGFGCNSVYRIGRGAFGVAVGDFDSDDRTDAVVTSRNDSILGLLRNSDLHQSYVTLGEVEPLFALTAPSGIETADLDKDGNLDLIYASPPQGSIALSLGDGNGGFAFPSIKAADDGAKWIAIADFDNDTWLDIAVSNSDAATISIFTNDQTGRVSLTATLPAGTTPERIIAAEIDGSPGIDLAWLDEDERLIRVFANDGNGAFAEWRTLATLNTPLGLTAADFDGDGRTDLASADRIGRAISVYRQTSAGAFETARLGDGATYTALETTDLNRDGLPDLVAVSDGPARLTVLLGAPGQDPQPEGTYTTNSPSNDLELADFNNDGFLDAIHNVRQAGGAIVVPGVDPALGNGFFNNGQGCATADYHMEFNIAFQSRESPDPVAQLHDLFDTWRSDLIGITDAVRSVADPGTDRLPVGSTTTITIEPLDWQQSTIGPGLTLFARHAEGSDGLTTLGATTDLGDGTYQIEVSAADLPVESRGHDAIEIVVEQIGKTIILMPTLSLTITRPVADWNQDGVVDAADLDAFLADWLADDPETDLTADGTLDTRDLIAFVRAWAGQ